MNACLRVELIPAFRDNYIWCLRNQSRAVVVDPGDAEPVFAYLAREKLALSAILATHHHADHVGGIAALARDYPVPVYAPFDDRIVGVTHPLREADIVYLPDFGLELRVLEIPGHTLTHIAYYGANMLFCGDTLFACGCGRLFEGTPGQMLASLTKIAGLPDATLLYCGHEYTLANLRFARTLDPANSFLENWEREAEDLRRRGQPTLPSTLAREKRGNPFLRCTDPAITAAASREAGRALDGPVPVFALLREWKNRF